MILHLSALCMGITNSKAEIMNYGVGYIHGFMCFVDMPLLETTT